MKTFKNNFPKLFLCFFAALLFSSCEPKVDDPVPVVVEPEKPGENPPPPDTKPVEMPFTAIPDELVGTWYAEKNPNPMTENWEQGTFQGESGMREYRTMVFTKNGKDAIEYTSWVSNDKKFMFKRTGTLEYKTNPVALTFHAQSGKVRQFSNSSPNYIEADINPQEWGTYKSVLIKPEATTYSSATNFLTAKRSEGGGEYSVKYTKVGAPTTPGGGTTNPGGGTTNPGGGTTDPGSLYSTPPTSGTYVQIGNQYYPTVTIGDQEWMSVNYAGNGGMKDSGKPHYGTFYKFADLKDIPVPVGWRIPSKQDYIKLLKSQGLELDQWGYTNGTDVQALKMLGQLMSTTGWKKQDGYASNKSGFNAVPANLKVQDAQNHGEGTNCYLWISDKSEEDHPIAFEIIQLTFETYSSFRKYPIGFFPAHIPVRLVKDR